MELEKVYITGSRLEECIQYIMDSLEEDTKIATIVTCTLEDGTKGWMISSIVFDPKYEYLGDWVEFLNSVEISVEINVTRDIQSIIDSKNYNLGCILLGA